MNQYQIQFAQWLVDHGFCKFVVMGYHQQLHGKFFCDLKFGHFSLAWRREARFTTDCLLRILEKLPHKSRTGGQVPAWAKDTGVILDPLCGALWRKHLCGRYLGVFELGADRKNIHLAIAGHDLDALDDTLVVTRRLASTGAMVEETTSLRREMAALCSGQRGVVALWNYPPEMSAEHRRRTFYL